MTIKCADEQALDLLSKPSAARVQLARVRLVGSHATQDDIDSGRSNNSFAERFGGAFFWASSEGATEPGIRVLSGELEVKKSLKLGFVFPRFSVRVSPRPTSLPGIMTSTCCKSCPVTNMS